MVTILGFWRIFVSMPPEGGASRRGATLSDCDAERVRMPPSVIVMRLRFQRRVSGNWILMSPRSTVEKKGLSSIASSRSMIEAVFGLGLMACAMLRLDKDVTLDIRFKRRLDLDILFSSLILSRGTLVLGDLSLIARCRSVSLPSRLDIPDRMLATDPRRLWDAASAFGSVLEDDTDLVEE